MKEKGRTIIVSELIEKEYLNRMKEMEEGIIKNIYTKRLIKVCQRMGNKGNLHLNKMKRYDLYYALRKQEAFICGITIKWVD